MPRRSNPLTYIALTWLGAFVLMAHVGVATPDGFAPVIVGATLASIVYLYVRLCRRWPLAGWLGLGLILGLFGGGYHSHHTTTAVEREYDGDCVDRDNCDGDT